MGRTEDITQSKCCESCRNSCKNGCAKENQRSGNGTENKRISYQKIKDGLGGKKCKRIADEKIEGDFVGKEF